MKGDFTRQTFDRSKHYSSVRLQQGRVQLDADWNEASDIATHLRQTGMRDLIGLCGAPMQQAGFAITPTSPPGGNLLIGAGRYYVHGTLCENDADVLFTEQPDFPAAVVPPATSSPPDDGPGQYLAYLDVWQRHITALEDPQVREVALGGPDTATRTRTVWQVKLVRVGELQAALNCLSQPAPWLATAAPSTGRLQARAQPSESSDDPCIVPPGAGFRRLENQLYRVEIQQAGTLGTATFKWSRDNGSVVTAWLGKHGNDLTVSSPGRDRELGFASGQWIELTDDTHELHEVPGTLVQLLDAEGQILTIDPATATGPVELASFASNPRVRRWDMAAGDIDVSIPAGNDGWIALEDGVEIRFQAGTYHTGDYWLIPARTATGNIAWPHDATNLPQAQLPHGIQHQYCRLALLGFDGLTWTRLSDCRSLFPPVTQLTSLFYVSGDGQEVTPDPTQPAQMLPLAQALQVGVANGQQAVAGATVRFTVTAGNGSVTPAETLTGADGIASSTWSLDSTTPNQSVEATLHDAAGSAVHLPIRFTANLSLASEVAYDASNCPDLAAASVRTVQDAIDELCQRAPEAEPGIGIQRVVTLDGVPLRNDDLLQVVRLARGLRIVCDAPLSQESGGSAPQQPSSAFDPSSIPAKPTCVVTLDMPYPLGIEREIWNTGDIIGFQPLILGGRVVIQGNELHWLPSPPASNWLLQRLFQVLRNFEAADRVLGHLAVKGNFIWRGDADAEPTVYLDGQGFGHPAADSRVEVRLPSGDGRRGGDFEMWFWLLPETTRELDLDVRVISIPVGSGTIRAVSGSLRDPTGAAISGAVVTLSGPGGTRTAVTGEQGSFTFANLAAGAYTVTATVGGVSVRADVTMPGGVTSPPLRFDPDDFPGRSLDEVSGIGNVLRNRLEANGVTHPALVASMEPAQLAAMLDIPTARAGTLIISARRLLSA